MNSNLKEQVGSCLEPYTKINFIYLKNINVKMKLSEENKTTFFLYSVGKTFVNMIPIQKP